VLPLAGENNSSGLGPSSVNSYHRGREEQGWKYSCSASPCLKAGRIAPQSVLTAVCLIYP